jgi:single-stranded-DNA-specific exonuclease
MAAGLTMRAEHTEALRKNLNAECTLTDNDFIKILHIDAELNLNDITVDFARELERFAPFGAGNPEPLFSIKNVLCESIDRIGADKKTLRFTFADGNNKLKGIAFGMYEKFSELLGDDFDTPVRMDIVFQATVNEYNGMCSVQAKVADVRLRG